MDILKKSVTVSQLAPVMTEEKKVKKVHIICSKGKLEEVYAALVMAKSALMEGIEVKMFFTFFGLEAITKKQADHLHNATIGNPAFMPGMPTMVTGLAGFEGFASYMMKREMDTLDIPQVTEFIQRIDAAGGEIYACKLAAGMVYLKKEIFCPK